MTPITDPRQIDAALGIQHFFSAGQYAKLARIPAGERVRKHVHSFSHDSVLVAGSVQLDVDGQVSDLRGPCLVRVEAGKEHTVTAVTDALWACVHDTDETDPERIDHVILQGA